MLTKFPPTNFLTAHNTGDNRRDPQRTNGH